MGLAMSLFTDADKRKEVKEKLAWKRGKKEKKERNTYLIAF